MAERKIEIQMAAVNAAETAADITKSTEAVGGLTKATKEQSESYEEGMRKAQEADRTAMREKIQATAAITAAFAYAKQSISEVAEALDSVDMEKATRVDPQGAAELEKMAGWAKVMDSPIKALKDALYEAASGDTVAGAFKDLNTALANAAKDHAASIDRIIQSGIRQTDELKRLADAVKAANAVLDAKDDADSAARDRSDAAAKRGGADPVAIDTARARDDAKVALAKIQREREQADAEARAAMFDAEQQSTNFDRVSANPNATQEDVENARDARDAKGAFARSAMNKAADFGNVATHRERKIRENAAGRIERIEAEAEAEDKRIEAEDAIANEGNRAARKSSGGGAADLSSSARALAVAEKTIAGLKDVNRAQEGILKAVVRDLDSVKRSMGIMAGQIKSQRRGR